MSEILSRLKSYDAKERSNLIRKVFDKGVDCISPDFMGMVIEKLEITPEETEGLKAVFWAMDYHLDWLVACLCVDDELQSKENFTYVSINKDGKENRRNIVRASQEDIDFLVVLEGKANTHMVFIEAKLFSSWDNEQLLSKVERINAIFEKRLPQFKTITPHLCLLSRAEPRKLITKNWPDWATNYAYLQWNDVSDRKMVVRCNDEIISKAGTNFKSVYRS